MFYANTKATITTVSPSVSVVSRGKDFMALAAELAIERHISKGEAVKQLAKENPELHRSYLASLKPVRRRPE